MLENMALRLCCEHRLLRPRAEPTAGYTHSGQAPQEHPAARHVLLTHTEPASDTQAPGRAEASCSYGVIIEWRPSGKVATCHNLWILTGALHAPVGLHSTAAAWMNFPLELFS